MHIGVISCADYNRKHYYDGKKSNICAMVENMGIGGAGGLRREEVFL